MNLCKKAICLILGTLMMFSLITACGVTDVSTTEQQTTSTTKTDTTTTTPGTTTTTSGATTQETTAIQYFDPSKEDITLQNMLDKSKDLEWRTDTTPVTLKAYFNGPTGVKYKGWGNDPVSAEITKRTGVSLEITEAATTDSTQLMTMLASGEVPDFLLNIDNTMRATLWQQGFALPLNKLIDENCPKMWSIIPIEQKNYYTETDGNMYTLAAWYADPDLIQSVEGAGRNSHGLSINLAMYKELGEPPLNTLEDYKAMLLMAKEKWPELPYYLMDRYCSNVTSDGSLLQLVNRIYGGLPVKAIGEDGNVHLNFRDEPYLKAIKYVNSLYRAGVINPENFAIEYDQFVQFARNKQILTFWGSLYDIMSLEQTADPPYKVWDLPQEPGYTLHLMDDLAGNLGGNGPFITSETSNPKRAIYYLEFLQSQEGQMLLWNGIEGEHYTIENGYPKTKPEVVQAQADFDNFMSEYGIINWAQNWITSGYTAGLGSFWTNQEPTLIWYRDLAEKYAKYARDEFLNSLSIVNPGTDESVIEAQIFDLWAKALPKMYLAKTEDECVREYENFVADAEKAGLKKLEEAYTKNMKIFKEKLGR